MLRFAHTFTLGLLISLVSVLSVPFSAHAIIFESGFEKETVASGFILPVAMDFAPDGRVFVAEKGGTVRVVENDVLLPNPVITLTDINTFGDRGLLGIAVDPNFAQNGYLYLSYTFENTPGVDVGGEKTGRIVRVTVVGNSASESSKVVLVGTEGGTAGTPSCEDYPVTADCIPSDSPSHSVGGLRFGPDGTLYATLGDGANFDYPDPKSLRAQNLDSLAGKVLRVNTDGTAPSDNPYFTGNPNDNRSKVFALGMRNAFRLNFNPVSGALVLGDVGWSDWEEVNEVTAGANYGWPCWEGLALTTHNCAADNTAPLYHYAHNEFGAGSVTVGSFPANNAYPDTYDNNLFIGDYAQNWIKRIVLDENDNFVSIHDFMDDPDGPVDISTGPDGNIYFLSIYTGTLHRLTHTTGNRRPVAEATADPIAGLLPLDVAFSSAGSYDPDDDPISYHWSFGDGATVDEANPTHTYTLDGTYVATLTVTDIHGSSAGKSVTITAGNQAPTAAITAPASGSLYTPHDVIQLTGTGIDPEDGTLPASAFSWRVILHHNTHIHIEQQFTNTTNPWFIAPDHNATDVYVEIELTVTDSNNLTHTTSINLYLDNGSGVEGNLIENPSVEIPADGPGGNPLNWIRGNFGFNNPTFTYPVTGFDGEKAMQLSMDFYSDGNAKWYFSPVSVTPGEEYRYSEYYTADVVTSIYAQLGLANGTYQYVDLGAVPAVTTPTYVEKSIVIPEGVQTMTIWHELYAVGTLTTDNFSLVQIDNTTDTTPPVVVIDAPIDGATVSGTVMVEITAGDSGGMEGVHLLVNDVEISEDTTVPYSFALDTTSMPDGLYELSAHAHDLAGNSTVSDSVFVTVSNGSAIVNLVQNADFEIEDSAAPLGWNQGGWGNHARTYTYPIVGYNGGKAVRVEITDYPDPPVGTGDAKWYFTKVPVTPGIEYTYSDHYRSDTISDIIGQYTLSDGSFHYFGLAKEIQPTTEWAEITSTFTPPESATHVTFFHLISAEGFLEIDDVELYESGEGMPSETNTPIVEFLNPLEGQTVSGIVTLNASSTDDTAVTYIFYAVDGIPVTGQITEPPYAFDWDTTTHSDGPHTLKATTHDPSGNNSTHTITVTVDNTTPPPTSGNLILNPSLETAGVGGDPEQWFRGGWGTNTRTFTYPTVGSEGADAAKIEITAYTDGDAKWYFADVPVVGGATYHFAHDYQSSVATEVIVRYTLSGGGFQYQFIGARAPAATWTSDSFDIVAPANAISVTVFHVIHSVGVLEVDNFTLLDPSSSDTTPPSVSLGAIVPDTTPASGIVSISANASDDVAVAGVTLLIDGEIVGAEDTTAPYEFLWDTQSVVNGVHTIALRARDTSNNETTSPTTDITVDNETVPPIESLITNPSFETSAAGNPSNWIQGRWGTNATVFTYPVAGTHGSAAARIEMTSYTNGDAKWRHDDVSVTPGGVYTFEHDYRASVLTNITVRYTRADGSFQYVSLGNFPAVADWTTITQTFVVPTDATSMTIFHILNAVGWLEVDRYALVTGNENEFDNGMISLTFDDGWISQYTTALPILDAANVDGVFYIISQETLEAVPVELVANADLETIGANLDPEQWFRGGWGTNDRIFTYPVAGNGSASGAKVEITSYTDGDAKWYPADSLVIPGQDYAFSTDYSSTVDSEAILRVTKTGGAVQYLFLANLPATGGAWQTFSQTVILPGDAVSVTLFQVIHGVGELTVDNYSVKRIQDFVDVSQVLEMQAAGHEIGAHTRTHPALPTLTLAQMEDEIAGSRTDLLGMGVTTVETIAYPFGEYNVAVQTVTQTSGFTAGRGVEHGYNTKATDKYGLKIQRMDRTVTIAEVQSWIAQAQLDKTWLILMFHQVNDDPAADLGVTAGLLQDTVNAVVASGIEVVSVAEGVTRMNP